MTTRQRGRGTVGLFSLFSALRLRREKVKQRRRTAKLDKHESQERSAVTTTARLRDREQSLQVHHGQSHIWGEIEEARRRRIRTATATPADTWKVLPKRGTPRLSTWWRMPAYKALSVSSVIKWPTKLSARNGLSQQVCCAFVFVIYLSWCALPRRYALGTPVMRTHCTWSCSWFRWRALTVTNKTSSFPKGGGADVLTGGRTDGWHCSPVPQSTVAPRG